MSDLIKLVRTLRFTSGLTERLQLTEEIVQLIAPDLRMFVFRSLAPPQAQDALQEILKAVVTNLNKFEGDTAKEFWGWCYAIARNKLKDQYRKQAADLMRLVPAEELSELIELSAEEAPLTPQTKLDLEFVMNLLAREKPECNDILWRHYVMGFDYDEIAEEMSLKYDAVRMKVKRCLDEAKSLIS